MASRTLSLSLRAFAGTRPSIQAWRSTRCFATEVAPASTTAPIPSDFTTPITTPVVQDGQPQTLALEETDGNTSGKSRPVGVVVSAGKMEKTVKVRLPGQKWNKYLRKHFKDHSDHLVHDPNTSLNIGDVVALRPFRAAKHVHHVVSEILVPFGTPITQRPPVPSEVESQAEYNAKRSDKLERRTLRRSAAQGSEKAIEKLRALEIEAGQGVAPGKGEKNARKAGLLGNKGQKLPKGVLPGGKHAVGKIDERAKHNKAQAMERNEKAEQNLLQAKQVAEASS
ncbi:nucleic acid-binding protein [Aureobasidium pullulans]|uniref:Nucleic acid-binding protein n=1 Tax=Aureobasidium pullulans TaxID=5580 RepID=A0A4S9C7W4_AURPU|nr:nucleic acid-binding protein [Aureobasidium pullulans]